MSDGGSAVGRLGTASPTKASVRVRLLPSPSARHAGARSSPLCMTAAITPSVSVAPATKRTHEGGALRSSHWHPGASSRASASSRMMAASEPSGKASMVAAAAEVKPSGVVMRRSQSAARDPEAESPVVPAHRTMREPLGPLNLNRESRAPGSHVRLARA